MGLQASFPSPPILHVSLKRLRVARALKLLVVPSPGAVCRQGNRRRSWSQLREKPLDPLGAVGVASGLS